MDYFYFFIRSLPTVYPSSATLPCASKKYILCLKFDHSYKVEKVKHFESFKLWIKKYNFNRVKKSRLGEHIRVCVFLL